MTGVAVERCARCARLAFPAPAVCHRCGSTQWETHLVGEGVVEQVTRVERAVGSHAAPVVLASVRLSGDGPVVIARLRRELPAGAEVRIEQTDSGIRAASRDHA